jgi:hypothetical protein
LDTSLQDCIRKYAQGQIQIQDLVKSHTANVLSQLSSNIHKMESLVSSEHDKTRAYMSDLKRSDEAVIERQTRRQRLLKSLEFRTMNKRRSQINQPYSETFEWIFKAKESDSRSTFRSWMQSDEGIFWISGKAGSGKSTLMKYLTSNVLAMQQLSTKLSDCIIYSYFIWNSGSKVERSLKGMFCSLIHQVLQNSSQMVDYVLQRHTIQSVHNSIHDWELIELRELLSSLLQLHCQPVCLFIDGLDEIDAEEDPLRLVEIIQNMRAKGKVHKICVSSRPEPVWNASLNRWPSLQLQDLTKWDMQLTAQGLLNTYFSTLLTQKSAAEMDSIVLQLVFKAEGVFLWLQLALRSVQRGLCGQETERDLLRRLEILPQGIQQLYQGMWKRLGDDEALYRQQAAQYFRLALQWEELRRRAFIFHRDEEQVLTSLGMLTASDKSLQNTILASKGKVKENSVILEALKNLNNLVETRCAGILEVSFAFRIRENEDLTPDKVFAKGKAENYMVQFIHRTARDYLLHTAEGLELLECWSECDEELNLSIIRAMLCNAFLIAGRRRQGFEMRHGNHETWFLERDMNLGAIPPILNVCCQWYTAPSKESVLQVLVLLRELYESRSLTTFLEEMAKSGFFEWWHHLLDAAALKFLDECAVVSYLFSKPLARQYVETRSKPFISWIKEGRLDLGWSDIHTATLPIQNIPVMTSVLENTLLTIIFNPHPWLRLFGENSVPWFLTKNVVEPQKRLLLHLEHSVEISSLIPRNWEGWAIWTGGFRRTTEEIGPMTHFIVEVNIAQLVNSAISAVLQTLLDVDDGAATADSQVSKLGILQYEPQECHYKILIAGNFDTPFASGSENRWDEWARSGEFGELTETQSNMLVERIFASGLPHMGTRYKVAGVEGRELFDLVESMVSHSSCRVKDIANWLRQKGYYIPTQGEVDAYIHGKTFADRVLAIQSMNKKHAESIVFDTRILLQSKEPNQV